MIDPNKPITVDDILADPVMMRDFMDRLSRQDMATFAQHILGYKNAKHHKEWYGLLQGKYKMAEGADWDAPLIENHDPEYHNNRIMLMAPRNHAKSTAFTVNYPLWMIGRNQNIRILLVSATGGQSGAFLREIKNHMMLNLNYRRVFGDIFPDEALEGNNSPTKLGSTWTSGEIIVKRTNPRMKDPTVAVTSALGVVLSRRADIIICDDILNEVNTKTSLQREKTRDWFNDVLMPVLEPDGKMIVVGTAWNLEDFYHELMKKPSYNIRKRYQAILDDDKEETLWPERWTYPKLMELKTELGSTSFNKSYMNMAMSQEDAIFKQQWTEAAKGRGANRMLLTHFDYASWDLGRVIISMGVDLAISQKDGSDFTAISVVAEVVATGMKVPLHLEESKYSPSETRQRIVEMAEMFNPEIIVVENNAYQDSLRIDLAEQTSLPIVGYTTGGEKFDPEIGLNSLAVEFENNKWILPYDQNSGKTRSIVDRLVDGMLKFPSGHTQDILMATWFANTGLRKLKAGKNTGRMKVVKKSVFNRR